MNIGIIITCIRRVMLFFLFMGIGVYGTYKLIILITGWEDIFKITKEEKEYIKRLSGK